MNYHLRMGNDISNLQNDTAKSRFVFSRKNQKGQVAVFVALIFQVIFIFFALLINVGLLVHHKINLQHSADLAAYYGAMKQAETLNTIAHVNFQIKQAWKLLTWRYRVLGTFGFTKDSVPLSVSQNFPFEFDILAAPKQFVYNGSMNLNNATKNGQPQMKCTGDPTLQINGEYLGVQDIPFFCVGHNGFSNWPKGESNCQLSCGMFSSARVITAIPNASGINTPFGGNVAGAINTAIDAVNANITEKCQRLGPIGAQVLSRFLLGYINETTPRLRTIEMLAKDLSLDAKDLLDIDGKSIFKASEMTFKNNLTGANFTGLANDSFAAYNGLSDQKCKFRDGLSNNTEFLKKIEFNFINYFIHNCKYNGGAQFMPEPVYTATGLSPTFAALPPALQDIMMSVLTPGQRHTVGFEKNPHCVEYYAVKAYSEPNIPFLPLSKIKLVATSVAKPFGGSIGPWYGKEWPAGSPTSQFTPSQPSTQMDETLPSKQTVPNGPNPIQDSVYAQPNFSLFVGDKIGNRDLDYIAAFHSMLMIRDIKNIPGKTYANHKNIFNYIDNPQTPPAGAPGDWPRFEDWSGIDNSQMDFKDYDTLATDDPLSGVRAIEIAAIAPNQFDIVHYSIDPDFYHNYYRRLYKGFDAIASAVGGAGTLTKDQIRSDFGSNHLKPTNPEPDIGRPLGTPTFSVRDQILEKNIAFSVVPSQGIGNRPTVPYSKVLNSLISTQSSLLTGWTFLNFSDYSTFPNDPVNTTDRTMSFGQCGNQWNSTVNALGNIEDNNNFRSPMDIDNKLPPTPGNCVTGGRTGYSVKLISPTLVLPGAVTPIENTMDPTFFSF